MNGFVRFKAIAQLQEFLAAPGVKALDENGHLSVTQDQRLLIYERLDSKQVLDVQSAAQQFGGEVIAAQQFEPLE